MTAQFSRPGAIDLSALRKPPAAQAPNTGAGGYVVDVTSEEALRSEIERSLTVVVLVSFWAPSSPTSLQINATLERLADEFAGRFVLARVDVEAQAQLAQTLGVPAAPLVVAVLRGQLAPLLQDALPEQQMREVITQVLQAAAASGVTGTAQPQPSAEQPAPPPPEEEPRYAAAEAALMNNDVDGAIRAYEAALAQTPGDPEAAAGLVRARLLQTTANVDSARARLEAANRPHDVQAQVLAADLDLMEGHVDDAFDRLIDVVRRTGGEDRDAARKHLLDLFTVVGDDDPAVLKARQRLATALF